MNRFEANLAMSILFLLLGRTQGLGQGIATVVAVIGIGYAIRAAITLWRDE